MLLMVLAVFSFACMDTAIKWLAEYYSSYQVSFFRGAFSLPFILVWFASKGDWRDLKTNQLTWHLIRGVMSVLFIVGVVVGLRELPIASAYAIFFSAPLLIALLSVIFLNETVGIRRWSAIFVGLIGVLIALNPTSVNFLSYGALACIGGVVGYSFVVIIIKKLSATESSFSMVIYFLLLLTVGCGLLALLDWRDVDWQHAPIFFILGLSGALGQYLITEAFKLAPVSLIAPLDYTGLVWAALFGYLLWSEIPTLAIWLGSTIIIGSGLYLMHRESIVKKSEPAVDPINEH
jgi:drug/metabolite transporter (DMT)-like permease